MSFGACTSETAGPVDSLVGPPRVFVACVLPPPAAKPFRDRYDSVFNLQDRPLTGDELVAGSQGAEILVVTATDHLDATMIARLPASLRIICTYSVGTDHIDLAALANSGRTLLSTPDVLSESCADIALLLMLGAARRAVEGLELVRSGTWSGWMPGQLLGRDVYGRRLGILGMGRIGRAVARRAQGFGMAVHYHNRRRLDPGLEEGALYQPVLQDLAIVSDILCVACPGGAANRHLINAAFLDSMPAGAIITNISRGDVIDDAALVERLQDGRIAAAGLDVFAGEPAIHPAYRTLPNVFGLPHSGSATVETRREMSRLLCDGIDTVLAGGTPPNLVC
jgi:lactate dehydrogenase-like 2-hydroxyacid dehydrogenase